MTGKHITIDAARENGELPAPNPEPLTLASLVGCTGMDVVLFAVKMEGGFT